jgi:hemerythrin
MAIIEWNESFSVFIESIDYQHKTLFNLINGFYDNLKKESNQEAQISLILGLQDYMTIHFNKEEHLMKKYEYPNFDSHKREHNNFINNVDSYLEKIKSGKLLISIEITNYIKNWISSHIMNTDKAYAIFFAERGVK